MFRLMSILGAGVLLSLHLYFEFDLQLKLIHPQCISIQLSYDAVFKNWLLGD